MKQIFPYVAGALIVGFIGGYVVFRVAPSDGMMMEDTTDSMTMNMDGEMAMQHAMIEVSTSDVVPTVAIEAFPDSKDGYNIHLITTNYTFTPETVGQTATPNGGHAHLYVNGTKLARLYGPWFNLSASDLKDGENEVMVTLNADDHSEWAVGGKHISAQTVVTK